MGNTDGHAVVVVSHDAAVASGAIGAVMAESIQKAQRFAIDKGLPDRLHQRLGRRAHPRRHLRPARLRRIFALNIEAQKRIRRSR